MNLFTKTALIAVLLLSSVSVGFAAEPNSPVLDLKGAARSAGNAAKTDAKTSATAAKENTKAKAAAAIAKVVDINSASDTELKSIPGIGEALAAKIIAGRPYANKAQLKSRKILTGVLYEQVKDLIIAKQPQK